jgi:hypothetical protein
MSSSDQWMTYVAQKLSANGFKPMSPELYRPQGYKYAAQRSRFEITKFGMVDTVFTFAEIPDLTPNAMNQFSAASFAFAGRNKTSALPNGFFMATFCFAVAITANLSQQTADFIMDSMAPAHWAANEMRVAFDLASGHLFYYQKTPMWGAAYYAGMRREIERNLK